MAAPTLAANTGLTLDEGATEIILPGMLDFDDAEQPDAAIVYTVTARTNGWVVRDGVKLGVGATFTQADIAAGLVAFRHDGSDTASAGFAFSVSDGTGNVVTAQSFAVSVDPIADAPRLSGLGTAPAPLLDLPPEDAINAGTGISTARLAVRFTVTDATTLDGLSVVLMDSGAADGAFNSFSGVLSWRIYSDNAASVGSTVLAEGVDRAAQVTLHAHAGPADAFDVHVDFPGDVVLAPGTYWIAIHENEWTESADGSPVWWPSSTTTGVIMATSNPSGESWLTLGSSTGRPITLHVAGDAPSVTYAEDTVNTTPQLLDGDVVFTDPTGDFAGGSVIVSGLLAEDRVAILDEGTGAGQIGVSGSNVTYGGVTIGSFAGGVGGTFTVTLNASATQEAVDALLEHLTYANASDTPTASRELVINVINAAGASIFGTGGYAERTGAANPLAGFDRGSQSAPSFVDFDNDGDLDMVAGALDRMLVTYRHESDGSFVALAGAANPFNGITVSDYSNPSFTDLDLDGDMDLVLGDISGAFRTYRNNGDGSFTQWSGTSNRFNGIDVGVLSHAAFVDLDRDGDLDAVIGNSDHVLHSFRNNGTGAFAELTGTANPFDGMTFTGDAIPAAIDIDRDGDLDLVVGNGDGTVAVLQNNDPGFTRLTGADNPLAGLDVGFRANPVAADIDGDGIDELVIGDSTGTFRVLDILQGAGQALTVNVTAETDGPTIVFDGTSFAGSGETAASPTDADTLATVTVALADGGYAILWYKANFESTEIYARIVAADGSQGAVFTAGSLSGSTLVSVSATALPDGGFVMAWHEEISPFNAGVYAQRFDAAGATVGAELVIKPVGAGALPFPDIAVLADGSFVVSYLAGNAGVGQAAFKRFDAAGNLVQDTTLVDSSTGDGAARVAALAGGGFVVTYHEGAVARDVSAQVFDASGAPVGSKIAVTAGGPDEFNPTIGRLADGGFVIAWVAGGAADGYGNGVFAQRYDASGAAAGTVFQVNAFTTGNQGGPRIVELDDGGFLIAFRSDLQDGSGNGGYAAYYGADGVKLEEFRLNETTFGNQDQFSADQLADGSVVAAWYDSSSDRVETQQFLDQFNATEQVALDLKHRIAIDDPEGAAASVTLSVASGVIEAAAGGSGAIVTGSGTASVTITGTIAQIRALLDGDATSTIRYLIDDDSPPDTDTLTVTLRNGGGTTLLTDNAPIAIAGIEDGYTGGIVLGGAPIAGELLTLYSTLADPDGIGEIHYRWQRDTGSGFADVGSDSAGYRLTAADVGAGFRVIVSYTDGNGATRSFTSNTVAGIGTDARSIQVVEDSGNTRPWTSITTKYDALGGMQSQTFVLDNGGVWMNLYDTANVSPILWASKRYDASNHFMQRVTAFDDGSFALDIYDHDDSHDWYCMTISYDSGWNQTGVTGVRDDESMGVTQTEVDAMRDGILWFVTPYDPNFTSGAYVDNLVGGTGADIFYGFAGGDTIHGMAGDDYIVGGAGNDLLTGGAGADIFSLRLGDGMDTITDFEAGTDLIDLHGYGIADFADLLARMVQDGDDVVITLDTGNSVTLEQVAIGDLAARDFALF